MWFIQIFTSYVGPWRAIIEGVSNSIALSFLLTGLNWSHIVYTSGSTSTYLCVTTNNNRLQKKSRNYGSIKGDMPDLCQIRIRAGPDQFNNKLYQLLLND